MAGQESLPGKINELRDVKVIKSFYAGMQTVLSLDPGMRRELQNT